MSLLLEATLCGSVVVIAVWALNRLLAARMSSSLRRWWWCFVPLAFLVPLRIPLLPALDRISSLTARAHAVSLVNPRDVSAPGEEISASFSTWAILWLSGVIGYLVLIAIQTMRATRRWSSERLSTDHALLELLEDCKAEAGVCAPVGVVVSSSVPCPAVMGWLRPRILLPASLVASMPGASLRPILLHELAHFRALDVPFNWLLTLTRAIHWFNPFVHLGTLAWENFREEAADETVVKWMKDPSGQAYAEAVVHALRDAQPARMPFGALSILGSARHLKKRVTLIRDIPHRTTRLALACIVSLALSTLIFTKPVASAQNASAEASALATMQRWLGEVDQGRYENGWKELSSHGQSTLSHEKWLAEANRVRTPLGKCVARRRVSLIFRRDLQTPQGILEGEFFVARFESSFENLKSAGETVTFHREHGGPWKVASYLIHP